MADPPTLPESPSPAGGAPGTPMAALDGPVEIAPTVWWVGSARDGDDLQCHAYLVEAGPASVLIDPGSVLTIDATLDKVARVLPLDDLRWVVCLHSDPDVAGALPRLAGLLGPEARVVTEWRSELLLRHYGSIPPVARIEDLGWSIPLGDGRELRFVLTPYLHFPGALVCHETASGVLFSSDLFGGFTHGDTLVATDAAATFEAIAQFHEHYMPSREILAAGLRRIRRSCDPIRTIAPQHGFVIPGPLVDEVFHRLGDLECGVFLLAHDDPDVAGLMQAAEAMRRIGDAVTLGADLPELALVAERALGELLPLRSVGVVRESGDGELRFSAADGFDGAARATPAGTVDDGLRRRYPLPGGPARAWLEVVLTEPAEIGVELADLFDRLAPALRATLERHVELREAGRAHAALEQRALRDRLTGLYNRHLLDSLDTEHHGHGTLLVDVDHFKSINDRLGHSAGDDVLRRIAARLAGAVRPEDLVVRYGGEEFLVLVPDASEHQAARVAERVRAAVAAMGSGATVTGGTVTVSVGAAVQRCGTPLVDAISAADRALYEAKRAGRNRTRLAWEAAEVRPAG